MEQEVIKFIKQKDYEKITFLDKGSFGKVLLIRDIFIDELFVVKKYDPDDMLDENDKKRFYKNFLDEIKILYKLNHKNIVRIFNYYPYENIYTAYIIMEYIQGKNIKEYFDDKNNLENLNSIFMQLIEVFAYIEEKGIIHRDIREKNILIDVDGMVKIIDFGLGKVFDIGKIEDTLNSIVNRSDVDTLPEEYFKREYTIQTDIYYLGDLVYRLIGNLAENKHNFKYIDILNKMIKKEKKLRYQSFADIKRELNKENFVKLTISQEDKMIYNIFSNYIIGHVDSFIGEPVLNTNITEILEEIDKVIQRNSFNEHIENNFKLINIIVKNDFYIQQYPSSIKCEELDKFYKWFKALNDKMQKFVLDNLEEKISQIPFTSKDDDFVLPF
ncbi:serine/threonine protein kinase [Campylobacter volucris]|uniref:serine/threonine-protein kinase n=2 Tax=Campylobacter volucris TaxID=1031542 RepID=UPI00189D96FB|nr:serine/threonine-protein kinase [Campylobacter volucris]MBF7067787.1 serine/threonine protein kinase [Campylobacter volucris]